jgi:Protein of unknown function (DUF1517)
MNLFRKMTGQTRYVVSRLFIQLSGSEAVPILGVLNQVAQEAIASDGDLGIMGSGLVRICEKILDLKTYWQAAGNEGDVFWQEEAAGDYVNELFTDSAERYLSEPEFESNQDPLSLPVTDNVIVMITVAFTGENEDIETDLANLEALERGLKALINLNYEERLKAIQIHFSPARFGDQLTDDQILLNFPELIPL